MSYWVLLIVFKVNADDEKKTSFCCKGNLLPSNCRKQQKEDIENREGRRMGNNKPAFHAIFLRGHSPDYFCAVPSKNALPTRSPSTWYPL